MTEAANTAQHVVATCERERGAAAVWRYRLQSNTGIVGNLLLGIPIA